MIVNATDHIVFLTKVCNGGMCHNVVETRNNYAHCCTSDLLKQYNTVVTDIQTCTYQTSDVL